MQEELLQLEKTVAELIVWKDNRRKERLVHPVDIQSKKALVYNPTINFGELPFFTGRTFAAFDSIITDLTGYGMEVLINNQKRYVLVTPNFLQFTAVAATDTITATAGNHNLNNGDTLDLTTSNTLPGGLNTITSYYVINRTGTTFQLSLTLNGPAVDITDTGTGTHYYAKT